MTSWDQIAALGTAPGMLGFLLMAVLINVVPALLYRWIMLRLFGALTTYLRVLFALSTVTVLLGLTGILLAFANIVPMAGFGGSMDVGLLPRLIIPGVILASQPFALAFVTRDSWGDPVALWKWLIVALLTWAILTIIIFGAVLLLGQASA